MVCAQFAGGTFNQSTATQLPTPTLYRKDINENIVIKEGNL